MVKVFVSYAGRDREQADELRQWLVDNRHEVFLAHNLHDGIAGGEQWRLELTKHLRWADAVVCVLTQAYLASIWCTAEVATAQSRGSRLIPIRAKPKVVHPLLSDVQHIDLAQDPAGAWTTLAEALRRVDAAGGFGWPDSQSPFPGLRPFDIKQHRVFFGRDQETKELAELLRSPAEQAGSTVLLVVGPSGCGKSSLVRAGLAHVMAQEPGWRTLPPILPGKDPMAALARELAAVARQLGLTWTVAEVREQLEKTKLTKLPDELLVKAQARRLLVVVDQFEELLTQTTSSDTRARFTELLNSTLGSPVHVVATLRPEFLNQLLVTAKLASTHTYTLQPLHAEALPLVIKKPAELAGIGVDDDLVTRLVAHTDSGEALPLLAFTLAQLAEGLGRGDQLSAARYQQLGGVQGALTRQADAALAEASAVTGRTRKEVIAGLLQLVTVDEQGRPTRWRVPRSELAEPVIRELDVFVARRLLTTDRDHGSVVVGVAHEAILSAWEPLAQEIKANVSALRASRAVEQAAENWIAQDRSPARLWERGQLAAALADTGAHLRGGDLVTGYVKLGSNARDFLRASIRRDRVRRGRATAVLSVLLAVALVAMGIAFAQRHATQQQRLIAVSQHVADQALELRGTNSGLAAQLALAAYRLSPTIEARGSLLSVFATPYSTQLTGHTNPVSSVAFSPDGHILATASTDQTVRLWDTRDPHHPRPLGIITGHNGSVHAVAFSPDGHTLATANDDTTARLWEVSDPGQPRPLSTLPGHTAAVYSVAFSPDGHTLATGSKDKTVRLWDVHDPGNPNPVGRPLTGHTDTIRSVAFSPDGRTLATASEDKTVRLWDVSEPKQFRQLGIVPGHTTTVYSVAFSPDGHILATGSDASVSANNTVRLSDISDPRHPHPLGSLPGYTATVYSVAFSPDGHILATGSKDITTRLWDIRETSNPSLLETFNGHTNSVFSVAFSPDGHTLATGSYDRTVRLWDFPGPIVAGHTNPVFAVAFSPDGHMVATASDDTTTRLWDVRNLNQPSPLSTLNRHTGKVKGVAFSPDGHILVTASNDKTARLWEVSDQRQPRPLGTLIGHTESVKVVTFSPDGHMVATGSDDNTARLWDIHDPDHPSLLGTITSHKNTVWVVTFSPDGHTLITGSADGTAQWWDIRDPSRPLPRGTLPSDAGTVRSVAFSPDGRTLAIASEGTVQLREAGDPHHSRPLGQLTGLTGTVYSVAFSPNGHTLATTSYDNVTRLWDVSTPQHPSPLRTLTGHNGTVFSVAFSPDGRTLVTGSADHTARLWENDVDSVADRVCRITPAITHNEWDQYLPGLPYRPPCR
ncbi:MAG: TIR domain-containing protein [Pseudonocardiales bacterium]|nr:TIR domain-containing protein [Pseudonocardiales bacterium]